MAKIKTTPALKKAAKRVSTGGKKKKTTPKPPTPKKHGEKRKLHINEVVTKLNRAVKDTHIPGVDNIVPKLLGVCKFNRQIIKQLLDAAQQQHIGNQVAEELFFTALKVEHYAKDTLRRVMIKSKKTDQEDVDFLNQMYRIDADFLTKVEPYIKRKYKKSKSSDKEKQKNTRRVSQLETLVGDLKLRKNAIANKRMVTLGEDVKKAKKVYFKAVSDFRKKYPMEDQDDIESVPQYEKWLNDNTAEERGAWEAQKRLLKAKEKEFREVSREIEKHEKELKETSGLAEYESDNNDEDDDDDSSGDFAATPAPATPASSSSDSDSDSDEEEEEEEEEVELVEPSQTQLDD